MTMPCSHSYKISRANGEKETEINDKKLKKLDVIKFLIMLIFNS